MADTLPPSNAPLKALGPVTIYQKPNSESSFVGQYFDPDNQFVPRPFKAGDSLGRSYGESDNGFLAIYYVVYTTFGPFWSKQYLKLADRGRAWEQSDGTGPPEPEPPKNGEEPKTPQNGEGPKPPTIQNLGVGGNDVKAPGTPSPTTTDPTFSWLKKHWVIVAGVMVGLVIITIVAATRR